ncbi:MAG: FHA domain-containing protein [Anaerolineales bacterium]|nr:FHA domain-containing protein [Anaerolineales bacterium]
MNQNKTRRKKSIARRASVKVELVIMALVLFFIAPPALAQTPVAKVAITYVETAPQKNGSIDVSAFVSVTDETGRPVSGLTAGDFILTENDQPIQSQSLSVAPATNSLTAVLLIDASARMADVGPDRVRTLDAAKDSAVGFIDALTDGDMVAVYEYDRQIRTLQTMTYDHNYAIDRGVNRLNASQSESACLFDALLAVQQELIQDSPDGQQAVVVITGSSTGAADGACGGTALDDLLNLETKTGNPIPVYSVGIGEAVDSDDLEQLSSRTGGQSFAALDAKSLIDQVLLVSTQLKNQYEINYTTGLNDAVAKVSLVERASQQSAQRNVVIPEVVIPTPTPPPPYTIALTVEQSGSGQLTVNARVPDDISLKQTQLFINNNLVQRSVTPPFGRFEIGLNELGSGKHNIRVRATDVDGVEASAEVDLTLTLPPTPVPTVAPTAQAEVAPVAPAAANDPGGETDLTDKLPTSALIFVGGGLLILVVGFSLIVLHLIVRARRAKSKPEALYPPISAVNYNVLDSLPQGDRTMIEEFDEFEEDALDQPAGDRTLLDDDFDRPDDDRTFIEEDASDDFDSDRTFIRAEPLAQINAKLVVTAGEFLLPQTEFELPPTETTIGRNSTKGVANDIPISDRETSRSHARIIYRNGTYFIKDLNSSTGTWVNEVKLSPHEEVSLLSGVEIALGPHVKFRFDQSSLPAHDETIFDIDQDSALSSTDRADSDRTIFEITEEKV